MAGAKLPKRPGRRSGELAFAGFRSGLAIAAWKQRSMKVGDLLIDEGEIVETFVRASGPGGQNVNKVASAGRIALRRAPFAESAERRRDQADQARRRARDARMA